MSNKSQRIMGIETINEIGASFIPIHVIAKKPFFALSSAFSSCDL